MFKRLMTKEDRAAARKAFIRPGWGYDQTNREFFKVLEKKGERTLIVQEVEQIDASRGDEGWMCGKALPGEELKKGSKPYMVRVTGADHVKIEGHYASLWDGKPANWTSYH